ncbi:hypothetical protein FAI41_06175 [Acetobacteraceae bacterium]|nr:hypothetical protein FAI41_06175 [Acetobacteraceae bacterium]
MRLKKHLLNKMLEKSFLGVSFLGVALAGCSSAEPHFYALGPKPMKVIQEQKPVGPIKVFLPFIPASIERDVMVRRVGEYEMTINPHASWSEPLSAQITGTFTKDLSQALPKELVYRQNSMVSEKSKIGIDLTVDSFSLDKEGHAIVAGLTSVSVNDDNGKRVFAKTRHFSWKSKQYADKGPQFEVDILSEGLAAWAADTASIIEAYGLEGQNAKEDERLEQSEKEADAAEKEVRQQQMIASANQKLAQEQKKIQQSKKKK